MPTSTVNITFRNYLLKEIDGVAKEESLSRSEFLCEAARVYIRANKTQRGSGWFDIKQWIPGLGAGAIIIGCPFFRRCRLQILLRYSPVLRYAISKALQERYLTPLLGCQESGT